MNVRDIIDNRELAALIWLSVGVAWCLFQPKMRNSLVGVVQAISNVKVVIVLLASISFSVVVLLGTIQLFGYSDQLIKVALFWQFAVGFSLVLNFSHILKDGYVRATILNSLGATALVEFVSGLSSFPLILELILLPVIVTLAGVQIVAQQRRGNEAVAKFAAGLLGCLGVLIFLASVIALISNPKIVTSRMTLTEFLVPLILNVSIIPFVYCIALIARYEDVYLRIGLFTKDNDVAMYAKRAVLAKFHLKLTPLTRWSKRKMRFLSRSQVDEALDEDIRLPASSAASSIGADRRTPPI